MCVLIVIGESQHIPFATESVPIEIEIGISKGVRHVRDSLAISETFGSGPLACTHIVMHIHVGEIATYA